MNAPFRDFRSYVEGKAETATPSIRSGLHESVEEFVVSSQILTAADGSFEQFEPSPSNEWLRAGYAAAVAYLSDEGTSPREYPATLAVYVEGDVTCYRFRQFEEATRAGQLWAVGLI
ncbi:hypothetical protein DC31_05915 [Microbacterium sp. CH12i]|uniref:hypothetical protein n=1 Tax=Microbacterium sp. CH12i TaxID=1479651 RepID=UPI000461EC21|nr:hypothetical protein [Microbacterium sp. CH12i]KDA04627.1 hypothetical protein DC31_05915 [Microbacterium sp. CH12i]